MLKLAGVLQSEDEPMDNKKMTIVSETGIRHRSRLSEMLDGKRFAEEQEPAGGSKIVKEIGTVPAVIFKEGSGRFKSGYRLAVGQQNPKQYSGRRWARHIVKIDIDEIETE